MKRLVVFADEAWTDESGHEDRYYRFYGGCAIEEKELDRVNAEFFALKEKLGLIGSEIKWSKVTKDNAGRIAQIIEWFFTLVQDGTIKYRHLFCDRLFTLDHLTEEQRDNGFFILYYFFLKRGFGLNHCEYCPEPGVGIRFFLDQLPQSKEKRARFVEFLKGVPNHSDLRGRNLLITEVADVNSKKHPLLQCCDLVIGAFGFYLNRRHRHIPAGKHRRAETTVAKEWLYRQIYNAMRRIDAEQRGTKVFNAGETTGLGGDNANLWFHRARIWKFEPKQSSRNVYWSNKNWLERKRTRGGVS